MRMPNGLYGSATDADTPEGEGSYYTFDEIASQEEALLFRLTECGSHEGRYLPWLDFARYREHPEQASRIIAARSSERSERTRPELDTKAVFAWNAFLGHALYECSQATGDASIRVLAEDLAAALESVSRESIPHVVYASGSRRGYRYLSDYAAYLLLLTSTPEAPAHTAARIESVIAEIRRLFVHDGRIWHTDHRLFESQALWQDTPFPSGGSMLLTALARAGNPDPELASLLFTNIVDVALDHPVFFSFWLKAFGDYLSR